MKVCSGLPGHSRSKVKPVSVHLGISVLGILEVYSHIVKGAKSIYCVSTQAGAVLSITAYYSCYSCVWLNIEMKDDTTALSLSRLDGRFTNNKTSLTTLCCVEKEKRLGSRCTA